MFVLGRRLIGKCSIVGGIVIKLWGGVDFKKSLKAVPFGAEMDKVLNDKIMAFRRFVEVTCNYRALSFSIK
jgi:hypothetical protein